MIRRQRGECEWFEFEQLQEFPQIFHGVFTRLLNFKESGSQERIQQTFGFSETVRSRLVHGKKILWVLNNSNPIGDGLITNKTGLVLLMTHADCQATVFYDPIRKVIANVHCGWRGNVQNIYAQTVEMFRQRAGSNPKDLLACISPSLGPNRSEFIHFKEEWPPSFWKYQHRPNYFDLWAIARDQLENAGLLPDHIEIAKICTYENTSQFFSYRRDKKTGRNGTVIAMRASRFN